MNTTRRPNRILALASTVIPMLAICIAGPVLADQYAQARDLERFAALPPVSSETSTPTQTEPKDAVGNPEDNVEAVESETDAEQNNYETLEMDANGAAEFRIPPPLQSSGNPTNKITLSLDKVPINDVVKIFTRVSGANIVSSIESEQMVTVSMYDVPWKEALSVVLDSADLVLLEKSTGIYTVISKENLAKEPLVVDSYQLKFLTSADVIPVAQRMLTSTNAVAQAAPGNMIMIKETADQISNIKDMLASIDKPVPQVFIEAKFVEMNEQAIKDLGINWQVLQGYTVTAGDMQWKYDNENVTEEKREDTDSRFDNRSNVDTLTELYDMNGLQYEEKETEFLESPPESGNFIANSDLVPTREITDEIERGRNLGSDLTKSVTETITAARSATLSADQFSLTLSALKQNNGIDIISNPKIIVESAKTATIHVGRQDPNVKAVADNNLGGRLTYQFDSWIESGVKLEVTPTVNTEDVITLLIKPTLSRIIGYSDSTGDVNTRIPILSTREIDTKFNVKSGQTAAIGGLTETRNEESVNKIPLLGDIPIIGKYLFSHTHEEKIQDEVVIFVTVSVTPSGEVTSRDGMPANARLTKEYLKSNEEG